jgi:hypothetical protein
LSYPYPTDFGVDSHMSERTVEAESHCALNLCADKRWTESDALDPTLEKPRKAQVVRIKIEAVSDSTSMALSLDGPFHARLPSAPQERLNGGF